MAVADVFPWGSVGKLNLESSAEWFETFLLGSIFDKSKAVCGCKYVSTFNSNKLLGASVVSEKVMVTNISQERLRTIHIRMALFICKTPHNKGREMLIAHN